MKNRKENLNTQTLKQKRTAFRTTVLLFLLLAPSCHNASKNSDIWAFLLFGGNGGGQEASTRSIGPAQTTATRVYGQGGDFTTGLANMGASPTAASLNAPNGVAVDSSGGLYAADFTNNRVLYYEPGSITATRIYQSPGGGGLAIYRPTNVAVDSSGGLYVADSGNNRVLYFPSGSTTASRVYGQGDSFTTGLANMGATSPTATSLSGPSGVAVDSSDGLYVADVNNNRVLYYEPGSITAASRVYGQDGSFTTGTANMGATSPTATSLSLPKGIAVDSSDGLYVTDAFNHRVLYYEPGSITAAARVYGQNGSFTTATKNKGGIASTSLSLPTGVIANFSVGVYVADTENHRVLYFPSGSTTATRAYGQNGSFTTGTANMGATSPTATSLNAPNVGISVDSSGGLYVADTFNNRVLYYPPGP